MKRGRKKIKEEEKIKYKTISITSQNKEKWILLCEENNLTYDEMITLVIEILNKIKKEESDEK